MNCIIVDDEPLAREAIELLVKENPVLHLATTFNSAVAAADYIKKHPADLIFSGHTDAGGNRAGVCPRTTQRVPGDFYHRLYGICGRKLRDRCDRLSGQTCRIPRFRKAVEKAAAYLSLLKKEEKPDIEVMREECMFIKSDRRYFKVDYKDILFIEGLKDYSVIQTESGRLITRMNLKTIYGELPSHLFLRIGKSYIVNTRHIDSFDNNDVYIRTHELAIGASYREAFFEKFVRRRK